MARIWMDGLIGDLGQHRVQWRDEHVHAEAAGRRGERRSHPSERMASAFECIAVLKTGSIWASDPAADCARGDRRLAKG